MAVFNINKEEKLNIPLIASQNFLITNHETCSYYKALGCCGATLTTELTKEEIKETCSKVKDLMYVNIFGYQLMAFSKRKLITDYFSYIKRINLKKDNYMKKEGKDYLIKENKTGTFMVSPYILDGLKYLSYFKDAKYIILSEFKIEHISFLKVLKIYNDKISFKENSDASSVLDNTSLGFLDTKTIYKVK